MHQSTEWQYKTHCLVLNPDVPPSCLLLVNVYFVWIKIRWKGGLGVEMIHVSSLIYNISSAIAVLLPNSNDNIGRTPLRSRIIMLDRMSTDADA